MAKATKRSVETLYRRVIQMRLEGATHAVINKKLGIKHAWAAEQRALARMPEAERKKTQAQLDKTGVRYATYGATRESKPAVKVAAKTKKNDKTATAIRPVPKPKDQKVARPKGAPSRIKNGADKAQQSDAERAATIDKNGERSVLNLTRAERERMVKDGKLPTADLAQLQKLEAQKAAGQASNVDPSTVPAAVSE